MTNIPVLDHNRNRKIRYFSMFSGVGGFEYGIERAYDNKSSSEKQEQTGFNKDLSQVQFGKVVSEVLRSTCRTWNTNEQSDLLHDRISTPLCVGYSEIDKHAVSVYRYNFGDEARNYGDATKINTRDIPDFDLLVGGFPCQAFSIAGSRRGFEDTRGTLFFEIARVLQDKRPKYCLLENVKGLLSHDKGETFRTIISTLEEIGYNTQWVVLNSKFHGVPQNRERIFIIGSIRGISRPKILPFQNARGEIDEQDKRTRQIIQIDDVARLNKAKLGDRLKADGSTFTLNTIEQRGIIEYQIADYRNDEGLRIRNEQVCPTLSTRKHSSTDISTMPHLLIPSISNSSPREHKWNAYHSPALLSRDYKDPKIVKHSILDLYNNKEHTDRSPTLTEPHHNSIRVNENSRIRRLTPVECERLQGFSDNWTKYGLDENNNVIRISDTQRYKMMGNAVTTKVITVLIKQIFAGVSE